MCGIALTFAYHDAAAAVDRGQLLRMRDKLATRGPDGAGAWLAACGRIGLAHRRLAIIDQSARAAQPMLSADGQLALSFNGEIYNFRELRAELELRGHRFRSESDTEVLLGMYAEYGTDMLPRLRGMFALALWDGRSRRLLLARDPFGIKPLYYADDGWTLRAASQVKALLASGAVARERDAAGAVGFYLTGSVPEPFTWYCAVRAVPAGCYLWVDGLGAHPAEPYYSIAKVLSEGALRAREFTREELAGQVRSALRGSLQAHLVADVPVGLLLSAGIDSSVLLALASEQPSRRLQCVTVDFEDFEDFEPERNESSKAASLAHYYGSEHDSESVTRADLLAELPRFLDAMDQPSIDGLNTWFASRAAARRGLRVVLSGVGGDELFGGYPSFQDVPRWRRATLPAKFLPGLGMLARQCATPLLTRRVSPKLAGLFEYGPSWPGSWLLRRGLFLPHELPALLGREQARHGLQRLGLLEQLAAQLRPDPGSDFARVATLESAHYLRNQLLRDTDWASMAFQLEVRTPLVDPLLLASLSPLMGTLAHGAGKQLLASAPSRPLPRCVRRRPKRGFGLPFERWLREEPELDGWRAVPQLAREGTPWARRWAWSMLEMRGAA